MTADTRIFELRTYTPVPGKRDALLERLRDTASKLFERHGMTNIGYWVAADADNELTETVVYLLAHASREAARASWQAFAADPEWRALKADGEEVTAKIESVFLKPTEFSGLR